MSSKLQNGASASRKLTTNSSNGAARGEQTVEYIVSQFSYGNHITSHHIGPRHPHSRPFVTPCALSENHQCVSCAQANRRWSSQRSLLVFAGACCGECSTSTPASPARVQLRYVLTHQNLLRTQQWAALPCDSDAACCWGCGDAGRCLWCRLSTKSQRRTSSWTTQSSCALASTSALCVMHQSCVRMQNAPVFCW